MSAEPMWVLTVTQEEWAYLDRHERLARKCPEGLRFALDSAYKVQTHTEAPRRTIPTMSATERNYEGMRSSEAAE